MGSEQRPDDGAPAAEAAAPLSVLPATEDRRPRVWTVFVAYAAAFAASVLLQILAVVILAVWYLGQGADLQQFRKELPAILTKPPTFLALIAMAELTIGLAAFIPAWFSKQPARRRLGLVQAVLPAWGYPVLVIGALLPLAFGLTLAYELANVIPPDPSARLLYEQMTGAWAVPFITVVAFAPAFSEEILFRGYMQRRLLERWKLRLHKRLESRKGLSAGGCRGRKQRDRRRCVIILPPAVPRN